MNAGDLAQLLRLERPLVFLDLETTTPPGAPEPDARMDRVVQVGVQKVYTDGKVTEFNTRVNPEQPINPLTTEKHGLTDADVADAPPFRAIARGVLAGLDGSDVAGFNCRRYDVRVLGAEFTRCGLTWDTSIVRCVDLYLLWAKMEPRDLAAFMRRFLGVEHQGHKAPADVAAAVAGLPALFAAFPDLPRTVPELDALTARAVNPNWIDPEGKFQWVDGVPCLCFTKHANNGPVPMTRMDDGFYRWILREDFSPEVKLLAENAMKGRYPTREDQTAERGLFSDVGY